MTADESRPTSAVSNVTSLPAAEDERQLRELWRRLKQQDDEDARDRLIVHYAPLVKYVAGRMSSALPAHVDESDLISYGLIGLIGAVERFDPGRSVKFETYAVSRIKGAIIDELRSLDWVPRSVRARAREIERKASELEHQLHRVPTDEELANALDIELEEFHGLINQISNSSIVALDEMWTVSAAGSETMSLIDTLGDRSAGDPANLLDVTELREGLADAIASLPEREKIVVALYYYDGLTLREIGDVLGVTESRVSQLHTKAILRLKGRLYGDQERT
jgi:RNA polymerase sigma factor for flagellar operon FliA